MVFNRGVKIVLVALYIHVQLVNIVFTRPFPPTLERVWSPYY